MITDWQPGSAIAFTFVYKDKEVKDKGTLLQFEPEKKFSYTYWSVFSATEDSPENYSEITFTITPNKTGILLQMTHINFPSQMMVAHAEKNWEEPKMKPVTGQCIALQMPFKFYHETNRIDLRYAWSFGRRRF